MQTRMNKQMRMSAAQKPALVARPVSRRACLVVAQAATATKTVRIGTRGSPLALAQAYLTRDLLKVSAFGEPGLPTDGIASRELMRPRAT